MELEKNEFEEEAHIGVSIPYKTVMVNLPSIGVVPKYLYYQLEFTLQNELDIQDYMDYKVKLIDVDTTMKLLKEGKWLHSEN